MTKIALYAQPYDMNAEGFYFSSYEEFQEKAFLATNSYGDPVEEFELQFIDGDQMDAALAEAWKLNQMTIVDFFDAVSDWSTERKRHYILAVEECGYSHCDAYRVPDSIEIDIYHLDSLRDLAETFIDDGLFGEVPENLRPHIDLDSIARDLSSEYAETQIAGDRFVYVCR